MWNAFAMWIEAARAQPPASLKTELIKIVATALIGAITGAIAAYITAKFKERELNQTFQQRLLELNQTLQNKLVELDTSFGLKVKELKEQFDLQREADRAKEEARLRDRFLSPLLFATRELIERLEGIEERLGQPPQCKEMLDWFNEIEGRTHKKSDFDYWCNDAGHFAVTTLYITASYFAYANRILTEAPFHEVDFGYSGALGERLRRVRDCMSTYDGIWRESQENLGRMMTKEDRVLSYAEMCALLTDTVKFPWFLILLNFYRKLHPGKKELIKGMVTALSELRTFLE